MKDKLKKFWAPMTEEFTKKQIFVNIVGAMGFIPAEYLSRWVGGGFWLFALFLIIWWAVVVLIYLTYRYLKNKKYDTQRTNTAD
jgi:membrane protein CcdC involved in cytochrome C biogenesis